MTKKHTSACNQKLEGTIQREITLHVDNPEFLDSILNRLAVEKQWKTRDRQIKENKEGNKSLWR